ncbi:MAG: hypothetical protein COB15_09715 [Flavobacteriales bacterium]|jgi:hypothetical protein|nr:MAG: hypothetical protein COB15_09715 [Flavobacteriales bacterium]
MIKYVNIEAADNGWVVRWMEQGTHIGPVPTYETPPMVSKEMVFKDKETDKAFKLFQEKKMAAKESKKGQL